MMSELFVSNRVSTFVSTDVRVFCVRFFTKEKPLDLQGVRGGIKWARTIDLHDVNVAL